MQALIISYNANIDLVTAKTQAAKQYVTNSEPLAKRGHTAEGQTQCDQRKTILRHDAINQMALDP